MQSRFLPPPLQAAKLVRGLGLTCLGLACLGLVACASPQARPLYQQLGDVNGIERLSGRLIQRMATDPRTSRSFDGVNLKTVSASLAAYLCKAADGPCAYEGETMAASHKGLDIKGSEFEATVQILRDELDAAGVSTAAKNELLRRLASTRRDIVPPGN